MPKAEDKRQHTFDPAVCQEAKAGEVSQKPMEQHGTTP